MLNLISIFNMDIVSIITPSYNSEKYLKDCILSVLNQTLGCWEMLIVDDASSDNSRKVIESYLKKDKRIKAFFLEKNIGPAMARNYAINKASGRYIAFLDSDDIWLPHKLKVQLDFMKLNNYSFPKNINVKLQKFFGGFSTLLLPNTLKDNQILRSCRDDLSKILGIKYDNHIAYTFHITLAYLLKPLTPKEVKNLQIIDKQNSQEFKKEVPFIELNNPEICVFNNMYKFTNVKKLTRIA